MDQKTITMNRTRTAIKAKKQRPKLHVRGFPFRKNPLLPTDSEVETKIHEIIYNGMVFHDFESAMRPLDPQLEVKVWEIIVRRCREFPELIYMLADLDLLGEKKILKDPTSLLNIEFKHEKKRKEMLEGLYYARSSEGMKMEEKLHKRGKKKIARIKATEKRNQQLKDQQSDEQHQREDQQDQDRQHGVKWLMPGGAVDDL
ncbi:uncharacterized protein [Halyomorpha halys]|uniref:uncharacterized protein isoform X2 n=1 Tax=Halyomorpha halys TaxID=286706 RepID=UPI0006D5233B|nr:uncharacterized protein LOC106677616 isoform X2 [Halyomorpha halys]